MHRKLAHPQGQVPPCEGWAPDQQHTSSSLGTAGAVGDCCSRTLRPALSGGSRALVCPLGQRRGDPLREDLSRARQLATALACLWAELRMQGLELGPWRGLGGAMCRKRGRNHLLRGLRCLHKGAWLCPREIKWLCLQVRGLAGACMGLARHRGPVQWWLPPARVLGTCCHLLPNVNSDQSWPRVQHRCLIKRCMVACRSTGTACPPP